MGFRSHLFLFFGKVFVRIVLFFWFLVCCGMGSTAFSQDLSLKDCLRQARTHSLLILQSQIGESHAKADQSEAEGKKAPQLSAVGKYTATDDPSTNLPDDNQALLRADQNLLPFLSPEWIRAGAKGEESLTASFRRQEAETETDFQVKQLYFSILRDQETFQGLQKVEKELKNILESLAPRYSVGRVPQFDKVKVDVALADLARQKDQTLVQLQNEELQLDQLMGRDDADAPDLKPLSILPSLPEDNEIKENLPLNPSFKALEGEVKSAQIDLDAAQWERAPSLNADFRYGYMGYTANDLLLGWDAMVEMQLPLFDWGQINAHADQARASYQLAQTGLKLEKQKETADFQQSRQEAQSNLTDEERLKSILPEVAEASHAAIKEYRRGAMGILEVTDAANLWLTTIVNERAAYYAYLSNLAKMERLTGGEWKVRYE